MKKNLTIFIIYTLTCAALGHFCVMAETSGGQWSLEWTWVLGIAAIPAYIVYAILSIKEAKKDGKQPH